MTMRLYEGVIHHMSVALFDEATKSYTRDHVVLRPLIGGPDIMLKELITTPAIESYLTKAYDSKTTAKLYTFDLSGPKVPKGSITLLFGIKSSENNYTNAEELSKSFDTGYTGLRSIVGMWKWIAAFGAFTLLYFIPLGVLILLFALAWKFVLQYMSADHLKTASTVPSLDQLNTYYAQN